MPKAGRRILRKREAQEEARIQAEVRLHAQTTRKIGPPPLPKITFRAEETRTPRNPQRHPEPRSRPVHQN